MYFEIDGTGLRILGSMHFLPAASAGLPSQCKSALTWPKYVLFESPLLGLVPHMKLENGRSLRDAIPEEIYDALKPHWAGKPHAIPLPVLKPWAAMISASIMPLDLQAGVEMLFQAELPRSSYGYLETDTELGALFDSVPHEAVLEGLRRTVQMLPEMQQRFQEGYDAWTNWDVATLIERQRTSPLGGIKELRQAGLVVRNQNWANQIATYPTDGTRYLFVVGFEHLIGQDNLIDLLRSKGMTVSLVTT